MGKCLLKSYQDDGCLFLRHGFQSSCNNDMPSSCSMTAEECRMTILYGNGVCYNVNEIDITCFCHKHWTGASCELFMDSQADSLTIGQKLLKEPIWIGMIVIVNLVVFFCFSYVIRRKCGQKIIDMLPKKKVTQQKESSSKDEQPSSIYTLPVIDVASGSTNRQTTSRLKPINMNTSSLNLNCDATAPSTPEVNENNRDAALKLFASYNSKRSPIHKTFLSMDETLTELGKTGVRGCSDGAAYFNEPNDSDKEDVQSHGILRSYTISSGVGELKMGNYVPKNVHSMLNSQGSPLNSPKNPIKQIQQGTKLTMSTPRHVHCYPKIEILNPNTCDGSAKTSDSECSFPGDAENEQITIEAPVQTHFQQINETNDSGYPSTLSSSVATDSVNSTKSQYLLRKPTPANVKRKLFASKAKSSSFYNISSASTKADTQVTSPSVFSDSSVIKFPTTMSRNSATSLPNSCGGCQECSQKDNIAHSLDSSLTMQLRLSKGRKGACLCHCIKTNRSRCCKHRSSRQNECGNKTRRHRRHIDSSFEHDKVHCDSSCNNDNLYSKYSSTESDTCACNARRRKNKFYRSRAFASDGSLHSNYDLGCNLRRQTKCMSKRSLQCGSKALDEISPSYKKTMLNSFLSDTYNASFNCVHVNENIDALEDTGLYQQRSCSGNSDATIRHNISSVSSESSMKSLEARENNTRRISTTNKVVGNSSEVDDRENNINLPNVETIMSKSTCIHGNNSKIQGRLMTIKTVMNDSAYQTKQSSIDTNRLSIAAGGECRCQDNDEVFDDEIVQRVDDKVRRHLQQAAFKLAMIKRMNCKQEISKDSAIHTFSEEDISDSENKWPIERRTSSSFLAQMKGTSLSKVQEELSVIFTDSFNTPTNEAASIDKPEVQHMSTTSECTNGPTDILPMTVFSSYIPQNLAEMEETHV